VRSGGAVLSGKSLKLAAIVLVAIVVAAGMGYWLFAPKMPSQLVTYTTQQTSQTLASRTVQSPAVSSTLASSTTLAETVQWINVSATKPLSYYISLLKSTGTQPYVQLAWELQALPDATNTTAVAKITYLALNATNPEVKEAFELMIKGGTPDSRDFTYTVPNYNTELQVLYWLACQNEFKKDDTLALAVAMVNGLWVTVGDDRVRRAVYNDTTQALRYFRETNEWQKAKGYYELEHYPLEAKICLAWTGNVTPIFGPFGLSDNVNSQGYLKRRLPLEGYLWNTVSVSTLGDMRSLMESRGAMLPYQMMVHKETTQTIHDLEYFFYFMNPRGASSEHWDYADSKYPESVKNITLDGRLVENWFIFNIDAMFSQQYVKTGRLTGGCMDETAWVDSWAKSVGVSTTGLWHVGWDSNKNFHRYNHIFSLFYDPVVDAWKADDLHLTIGLGETYQLTHIFRPPVDQRGYVKTRWYDEGDAYKVGLTGRFFHDLYDLSEETIRNMFLAGVEAAQMKQWLLYS
jgi:hypothetical protein